jgi:glycosyltransferase 2 family protein
MTLSRPEATTPPVNEQEKGSANQNTSMGFGCKKVKRKWLAFALRAAVTVVLFILLARSISWSTLILALPRVHYTELLLALAAAIVCTVFSSYVWHCLLLAERIHMDLARLINLYLVGMAFSHFLPTNMGGDAVKAYYVGGESGNMVGSTSAVIMSRVTSFIGMLLIVFPALAIIHTSFPDTVISRFLWLSLLLIAVIVGVIVLVAILPHLSARFLQSIWMENRMFQLVLEIANAIRAAIKRPRTLCTSILFGMLFWVASFLNYYAFAAALKLYIPLSFLVLAIPFISIIAALPISINGFGVRESAFVYILSTIHVPPTMSLLLALLVDAQTLLFGIIGGCIYLTMSSKKTIREVQNG